MHIKKNIHMKLCITLILLTASCSLLILPHESTQDTAQSVCTPTQQAIIDQLYQPTLYAPWRESYRAAKDSHNQECAFCMQIAENDDDKYLILGRFDHHVVMLNFFPYAKGHLLIVPYQHVKKISNLSQKEQEEFINLINISVEILETVLDAQGVNIGINLGKAAGASIPDHLHAHILPRKNSEGAFIQVIGKTQVIHWDLYNLYKKMKPHFQKYIS